MNDKVKIEIFGFKNQPAGGGCSCGGNCGPVQTIGEQYEELVKFLEKKYFSNRLDLEFIEINKENLEKIFWNKQITGWGILPALNFYKWDA